MSLTCGFYNSVEGDRRYDAIQMSQIFDGIIKDGVYATFLKGMVPIASSNASEIIIQPGRCWFDHTWTYIDANYPVEAPEPEVILDRIDALVLDINSENAIRDNTIVWVQGTPASVDPRRPTLTNTVTHHQYPLAYVYRKAGTTMIYTADITVTVGTSECPFATGVLEGIDLDAWINQWDDEFHRWENDTKTDFASWRNSEQASFESWMLGQKEVYLAWYSTLKAQMEQDLADTEAWVLSIQNVIDSQAASRLQAEIDEINTWFPNGSYITIHTEEPTLANRQVVISDVAGHSQTVTFDSIGDAVCKSFPYVGTLTISSTNGERTATYELTVPYFGRYHVSLAFWNATVNIVGDEILSGYNVTVKDSSNVTVTTISLDSSGSGVFHATYPDTYKFIYTYGGQTMEVSLAVTQETTYELELYGGFNFDAWLTAGRVSGSFSSLDEILADEKTLRQLFVVHDSVDYLASSDPSMEDVVKIFNTDLAAKWINLSDYALDSMYAVSAIKTVMDTVDKYGYGEWTLMPQVPAMTSNTAPYGEASARDIYDSNYDAWKAFDGSSSSYAQKSSSSSASGWWLRYHFTSPIKISKCEIDFDNQANADRITEGYIKASNNGTDWVIVSDELSSLSLTPQSSISIDTNGVSYEYYELECTTSNSGGVVIYSLQFYAWAPKGCVPVMTSNSAPYGIASASSESGSANAAWKAFDNNSTTRWQANQNASNSTLTYKFTNPVCVKKMYLDALGTDTPNLCYRFSLEASNDNSTWTTLINNQTNANGRDYFDVDNEDYFLYYRITDHETKQSSGWYSIWEIQFYGRTLDVSVPVMTGNTTPYGEASVSSILQGAAYYAFNGDKTISSIWTGASSDTSPWVKYEFNTAVKASIFNVFLHASTNAVSTTLTIEGSNDDNEYTPLGTMNFTIPKNGQARLIQQISNNTAYKYYRFVFDKSMFVSGSYQIGVIEIQFYGVDYSEKEFEVGATKKWLYDHGVELVPLESNGSGTLTKKDYEYVAYNGMGCGATADLTQYSLARCKIGSEYVEQAYNAMLVGSSITDTSGNLGLVRFTSLNVPNYVAIDISSDNQSACVFVYANSIGGAKVSVKELWLE